jgi:oxygen-dependent protoporphyrinogen oxidase
MPVGASTSNSSPTPVFLAPQTGIASLPDLLCSALITAGVEIRTSEAVQRLDRGEEGAWVVTTSVGDLTADAVVVALPAEEASKILVHANEELARLLGEVVTASVALVALRFDATKMKKRFEGTGFLVPAVDGGIVTASTFMSNKWPHIAVDGEVLIRASVGRAGDDRAFAMSDENMATAVISDLERMIGPLGEPKQIVVSRFANSFPQYFVGHASRVDAINKCAARSPRLALAGATYSGVGIPACIGSGRRAAQQILGALGAVSSVSSVGGA